MRICLLLSLGVLSWLPGQTTAQETAQGERHWAFQPVRRPAVPAVRSTDWLSTPIDAFVLGKLEANGLKPAVPADKRTLLRRVFMDLIGLPPTPAEQQAFLQDQSPDAFARVIDNLLNRPQYGERWARHWLDVVRYAESNGYERDDTKPHAWRYRDYVIDALNKDKPYDRFLIEQLAGDEIEGSNAETQIATTFMRLGTWDDEPAEFIQDRYEQLDDVLGTTATAFLGVTLRCARCHDHKFEPFTLRDYYRTLAVFEPLKRPQDIVSVTHRKEHDRMVGTEAELLAYREATEKVETELDRLNAKLRELEAKIHDRLAASSKNSEPNLSPETLAAFKQLSEKRSDKQKQLVEKFAKQYEEAIGKAASEQQRDQRTKLVKQVAVVETTRPAELPRAYIWFEDTPEAPKTHIFKRGEPTKTGDEVEPGIPSVLVKRHLASAKPLTQSTGRRIWFARWMASRDNPLTARVMINRLWQHHFGQGLVTTENDFGTAGEFPTHPKLLDWLADEFMSNGWRIKQMHRLILTSSVYQMSARFDATAAEVDPQNHTFWRWRQRRLDAEVIRDSVLQVSGRLNLQMHGPSVYPTLPGVVLAGQTRPGAGWGKSEPVQQARRSVYIFVKRSLAVPELDLLDAPKSEDSCEQRLVSTTGPQALTFLNGEFMQRQAASFAERLRQEAGDEAKSQVRRALELALCRRPHDGELRASVQFLVQQKLQIAADGEKDQSAAQQKALAAFCLVLLNTNEFVYTR